MIVPYLYNFSYRQKYPHINPEKSLSPQRKQIASSRLPSPTSPSLSSVAPRLISSPPVSLSSSSHLVPVLAALSALSKAMARLTNQKETESEEIGNGYAVVAEHSTSTRLIHTTII